MVVVALRMCLQYGRSFSLWRSSCPITTDVTTSGLSSVYPKKRAAAVAASLICRSDISPLARCVYVRRCTCVSSYVHSNARKFKL